MVTNKVHRPDNRNAGSVREVCLSEMARNDVRTGGKFQNAL